MGESHLPRLGKPGSFLAQCGCPGKALTHGLGASCFRLSKTEDLETPSRFLAWAFPLVALARETGWAGLESGVLQSQIFCEGGVGALGLREQRSRGGLGIRQCLV